MFFLHFCWVFQIFLVPTSLDLNLSSLDSNNFIFCNFAHYIGITSVRK